MMSFIRHKFWSLLCSWGYLKNVTKLEVTLTKGANNIKLIFSIWKLLNVVFFCNNETIAFLYYTACKAKCYKNWGCLNKFWGTLFAKFNKIIEFSYEGFLILLFLHQESIYTPIQIPWKRHYIAWENNDILLLLRKKQLHFIKILFFQCYCCFL